jgi:uncharacterized protein YggE
MAKMDKSVQKTLIIMGGILALAVILIITFTSLSKANTVTGNGQATIEAIPDLVTVYFSVQTTADTSNEATEENSEIVDDLITELIKQGFERNQIQTSAFRVSPNYEWKNGERIQKGYTATHNIKLEMPTENTEKIGNAIDAGVNAGAGISYINFELSQEKQNQYKAEALKLAAEDARIKAQAIADGLGKRLGRLVSTSDSNFNYYPWRVYESEEGAAMDASQAKEATTDIVPGEQEIYASVIAVFKIL